MLFRSLIDDAYNANADSMSAGLSALRDLASAGGRAVAVLGEMAELGAEAPAAYRETGRRAAECGVGLLVTVGPAARQMAASARAAGIARAEEFDSMEAALRFLREELREGDWVLVKGSRVSGLDKMSEALSLHFGGAAARAAS